MNLEPEQNLSTTGVGEGLSSSRAAQTVRSTGEHRFDDSHEPQSASAAHDASDRKPESSVSASSRVAALRQAAIGKTMRGGSATTVAPPPVGRARTQAATVPAGSDRDDETSFNLPLQAGQIAEELQAQLNDLLRREQNLQGQLALLDQEHRQLRLWAHQTEEEFVEQERLLARREQELNRQFAECEKTANEYDALIQDLEQSREALPAKRGQIVAAPARVSPADSESIRTLRAGVERELARQIEDQQARHQRSLAAISQQIERERVKIRAELTAELELERRELEQARLLFLQQRDDERQSLKQDRERLDTEIKEGRSSIRLSQEQAERQLAELREKITQEKSAWEAERRTLDEEIDRDKNMLEKRARLQQDHLVRLKQEVEQAQNAHRHEVQAA
ncbi:MAG: hypothetical protein ACKVT0_07800, partial [Planctomycetaceae bacterium]